MNIITMNLFMKRYTLIRTSTGQVFGESDDYARLEALRDKYEARDIICKIVEAKNND